MQIMSVSYVEHEGAPNYWRLNRVDFRSYDLITGRNSSGKSRIISIIYSLSKTISGRMAGIQNGCWSIELKIDGSIYQYDLAIAGGVVQSERLSKDNIVVLERDKTGGGSIYFDKLSQIVEFKIQPQSIAVVVRRDIIQHPFLEPLHLWAAHVRMFPFGTPFGKDQLNLPMPNAGDEGSEKANAAIDPTQIVALFRNGRDLDKENFETNILEDFRKIGYNCTDIGLDTFTDINLNGFFPEVLYVKEADLDCRTNQFHMSQGMFRALAVLINLNFCLSTGTDATILIDDIGEGLDYSRSTSLIAILVEKCESAGIQLIMTTNDRFIMNAVDLDHWQIVNRNGQELFLFNRENKTESFDDFKFLGLNNFDFFTDVMQGQDASSTYSDGEEP